MARTRAMVRSRRSSSRSSIGSRALVSVTGRQAQNNIARDLVQLKKVVKGIKPERKVFDTIINMSNIPDTTGGIQSICAIAQGDLITNRIGNKIRVVHINAQLRLSTVAGSLGVTPTDDEYTRFFLIQDTQQASDTTPTPTDVFENCASPQAWLLNYRTQPRYKVRWVGPLLRHAAVAAQSTPVAAVNNQAPTQSPVAIFKRKCDIVLTYNAGATGDIQRNGLFVMALTSLAADTADVDGYVRLTFTDD